MPDIDITRPELVWPGKYDDNGNRVENRGTALPFQVIETIQEGRATRAPGRVGDLFGFSTKQDESNWHNKLIWGDNLLVLASLLEEYAGKVDLIYIDPPFATGADFSFTTNIGEDSNEIEKVPSVIELKAYRDTWANGLCSYLDMMWKRLDLAKKLLKPNGAIYVHCDWHVGHSLKMLCDEIYGADHFLSEIIWKRTTSHSDASHYGSVHDSIFAYESSDGHKLNEVLQSYDPEYVEQYYRYKEPDGRRFMSADLSGAGSGPPRLFGEKGEIPPPPGRHWMYDQKGIDRVLKENRIFWTRNGVPRFKKYLDESPGMPASDLWTDIQALRSWHKEVSNYPTQKPEPLLERIIKASSNKDDLVLDFFNGSGTTAAVAEKLGRRWIACDLGRFAIHTTRKRLLDIPDCKPFEVLNLGKYERAYWQGMTFGETPTEPNQAAIAAYIGFILELYKAQGLAGSHIHGKKGRALVHVGAVDAPVTINQVNDALAECATLGQKELHILGWEWEMGMNDPIIKHAQAEYGISLRLLNIPREVMEKQAVQCGDIRFFDLAYLKADVVADPKAKRSIRVELKDFVIPDTDLIPEEVRAKISKWSDYIDYWAVDWDFRHDTFMNQWQTYRTRTQRKLDLASDTHTFESPGTYRILIKVVDIFGNDTNRLLEWEVK